MIVVFRADASHLIGTGHVMRCLTLASSLSAEGAHCRFICREQTGNLIDFIRSKGFQVDALPETGESVCQPDGTTHAHFLGCSQAQDARECLATLKTTSVNWLIVDHYGLDSRWEEALFPCYEKLMVIDDLADRPHKCHALLDQTFGRLEQDYLGLVPTDCALMCGSQFSLLRPEFAAIRKRSLERRINKPRFQKLLITMGGVDKDDVTGRVLQSLKHTALPECTEIKVVMGPHAPWLHTVRTLAEEMPWPTTVHVDVENMAELMAESDLAIGAAGATAWERCCIGLPSIMVVLADNQRLIASKLVQACAARLLTIPADGDLKPLLEPTTFEPEALTQMGLNAAGITDGQGLKRVLEILIKTQTP